MGCSLSRPIPRRDLNRGRDQEARAGGCRLHGKHQLDRCRPHDNRRRRRLSVGRGRERCRSRSNRGDESLHAHRCDTWVGTRPGHRAPSARTRLSSTCRARNVDPPGRRILRGDAVLDALSGLERRVARRQHERGNGSGSRRVRDDGICPCGVFASLARREERGGEREQCNRSRHRPGRRGTSFEPSRRPATISPTIVGRTNRLNCSRILYTFLGIAAPGHEKTPGTLLANESVPGVFRVPSPQS